MNLRRQLLIVSLLTLVLPWAGCQFIRETESALRQGQQAMLTDTAQAIADSLSQFPDDFLAAGSGGDFDENQLYAHSLDVEPLIDGYADDWTIDDESGRTLASEDGEIHLRMGIYRRQLYLFARVPDESPLFPEGRSARAGDRVEIVTREVPRQDPARVTRLLLATEAPGRFVGWRMDTGGPADESRVEGHWLDTPSGYQLEVRLPLELIGNRLGIVFVNDQGDGNPAQSATFQDGDPGRFIRRSPVLVSAIRNYARPDLRLIVTDPAGWRLAVAGELTRDPPGASAPGSGWLRLAYTVALESGGEPAAVEMDASGRERSRYVRSALRGEADSGWFRSVTTGRAVVAVAEPVWSGTTQTGVQVLQQGTAAILSLTNAALGRLVAFTLIATLLVAISLIGYASWLSFRIRRLSLAAEEALSADPSSLSLPSAESRDEIGDLSRSFNVVLNQLGNYNEYLRTLASKLSHELRTPLTIVNSSLENLEHEDLPEDAARYTARARDGTARLKKILDAMSEAKRVEELMESIEPERFDLVPAIASSVDAYAATWTNRRFRFLCSSDSIPVIGAPELLVQLLDKLVDNAIGFSRDGDTIDIELARAEGGVRLCVRNPGPPLPEKMRDRLFDSMVSLRPGADNEHLGLGLYIARLIAKGHNGTMSARNLEGGVEFELTIHEA